MAIYTVTRTGSSNVTTYSKTFATYRKAYNALGRVQEKSSKSSTIRLYEDNRLMDTFIGLN